MKSGNGLAIGSLLVSISLVGCQSALDRPDFDPEWSSAKALEQCDTDSDGHIDRTEAQAAPGILRVFNQWDTNGDELISADEIVQRIAKYRSASASIVRASFPVTYKKKPLVGAEVTLEAEPFMGEGFETISATSNNAGYVHLSRPNVETDGYPGIYLGVYRVRISKRENGEEILPAKYNTESELGYDSGGDSRRTRTITRFDLK